MIKTKVTRGVYWVEVPEADLRVLCGCPADSVKHLMRHGLIVEREKDGVVYETGPNAILLSDTAVQNGSFANLAEFPVLQMFYRQGILLPGHPNNTGRKPMLIGLKQQVDAQSEYIYRGNYGLVSKQEIQEAGTLEETAAEMMRLKQKFAFDRIMKTEELLESRVVDSEPVELRGSVMITRKSFNVYEFSYGGDKVTVDLNLEGKEEYLPPYQLGFYQIKREYFSVIQTGDGDGWDVNRPCMSSIVCYQGKIYLIDAGPSILHSLTSLGISVNEIEGIFHTHAHDDHFAGLTAMVRSDRLIKYYATPLVRASVVKKLSALMSMSETHFSKYFEVHDLLEDVWNDVDGLEVMPVFSPHPVETTVMFFRTLWENGYKTYAHLADTISLSILEGMITDDPNKSGVTRDLYDRVRWTYTSPADLKKIDIGGGLIHGVADDFIEDQSDKIILSHTALELSDRQKEIGSSASFGMEDVLIPARQKYCPQIASRFLKLYFPDVEEHELARLLNCHYVSVNPGTILIKKGAVNKFIYLILTGVVELIDSEAGFNNRLSAGSMTGETSALMDEPAVGTFRAASFVKALEIPARLYIDFAKRNNLYDSISHIHEIVEFLESTWLFGEMVSSPIKHRLARHMKLHSLPEGAMLEVDGTPGIHLIETGKMALVTADKTVELIGPGDFFDEETITLGVPSMFKARVIEEANLFRIHSEVLNDIPIVQWKLLETFEKRLRAFGSLLLSDANINPI